MLGSLRYLQTLDITECGISNINDLFNLKKVADLRLGGEVINDYEPLRKYARIGSIKFTRIPELDGKLIRNIAADHIMITECSVRNLQVIASLEHRSISLYNVVDLDNENMQID